MDSGITSALAAIMGALVGGLASLASTWIGERSRHKRDLLRAEIVRRQRAYAEFIKKASEMYAASATHRIEDDDEEIAGMVSLYAQSSRIRLFASDDVIAVSERVVENVIERFGQENISVEELRLITLEKRADPLREFGIACRRELQDLQK